MMLAKETSIFMSDTLLFTVSYFDIMQNPVEKIYMEQWNNFATARDQRYVRR